MNPRKWPLSRRLCLWVSLGAVAIIATTMGVPRVPEQPAPAVVPFSEFLVDADRGELKAVAIDGGMLELRRKSGQTVRVAAPSNFLSYNNGILADLAKAGVRVDVRTSADAPDALEYVWLTISVIFVAAFGYSIFRMTVGKVPAFQPVDASGGSVQRVLFSDVAGADEAKEEVKEVVDFLREPERFGAIGGRIPKGVLLIGPPGTGKTLLAKSIAGEANVPFLFASGSDFVEMYAGVGAARIRRLFKSARKHPACIIFIDEIDAVGRSRGGQSFTHEEREQTLNQLLVEMDGFAPNQGIVVIAATNRPDILDAALLRPGRFDRQVTVGAPDVNGREEILRIHSRKVTLAPGVDLRRTARGTPGFCGADLANLINEAALLAARDSRREVTADDLDAARDKVLMGVERRSLKMTERDRETCAYHEAGHAVVAALLPGADPLHKVTIIPRGRALGLTMQLPEGDRHMYTREYLEAQIAILMGGRVAEELFLDQMTSGASNDIERATEIARAMVCNYGMSAMGPLAYRPGTAAHSTGGAGMSEAMAQRVDEEIQKCVMRGYDAARHIVRTRQAAVKALALELLVSESIDGDGIRSIVEANAA
jgi:cell division protease FtsH